MFKRKSDFERQAEREEAIKYEPQFDDGPSVVLKFIRDRGTRETFESIVVAIILALLFRNFLGEAYIIPTGSMAPTLMGRHMDVECPKCKFEYQAGASSENNIGPRTGFVEKTACPICHYALDMDRAKRREHRSFAGDRILVNRFLYDFQSPERWDVIVFKYPNNGKQNYIKRCVGIPGEGLLIENGDIYTYNLETETFADRQIARKSPEKLAAMLQLVHDTDYFAEELKEVGWPSHWQQWGATPPTWNVELLEHGQRFSNFGNQPRMEWLGYRHCRPRSQVVQTSARRTLDLVTEWNQIELGVLPPRLKDYPGELITDHYAYNETFEQVTRVDSNGNIHRGVQMKVGTSGLHWVGDLGLECLMEVKSSTGRLGFDLVEGGVHFTCTIDVATGLASLSASDPIIEFVKDRQVVKDLPPAQTPMKGPGKYLVKFVNADDRIYLYVNDRSIPFDVCEYQRDDEVLPSWTEADPLDAQPLSIGTQAVDVTIDRIQVLRDVYYVSGNRTAGSPDIGTEYPHHKDIRQIRRILNSPETWESDEAKRLFNDRKRAEDWVFKLSKFKDDPRKDEFMPMGDNSPESSDARIWDGLPHVDRDMLLGRAMYIYWPHAKTKPLPFWPNFERMKLIR